MKIQCDVCNKDEASVFCTADEAALCDACDHRVHHANKLASKHQRFSLLHPSSKQVPLCDVCQERRAFLFCREDRAILCRDCDIPIHTANEHTQKHNRFLLTGVKLSATSTPYTSTSSSSAAAAAAAAASTNVCEPVPDHKSQPVIKNSVVASLAVSQPSLPAKNSASTTTPAAITDKGGEKLPMDQTSSISEYLIETLPGWHVEDFLDSTYDPFNFCKSDDGVLPFLAADIESNMGTFSPEISFGIWVPRSPAPLFPPHMAAQTALKEAKEGSNIKANRRWMDDGLTALKEAKEGSNIKANRRWMDDGFTVPQITTPSTGSKRSRPSW